jgi:hypothetical protein
MKNEETCKEAREASPAEIERARRTEAVRAETAGLAIAFNALQPLDHEAQRRALRWLADALDNIEVPF